ncbi:MAG: hypothetical protein GPJ54_02240 [Candidatus Heimdallarchaeota archaeon]|nr:hypothetical protein [Candidatus Heimdallarchaeota archaeon]
MNIIELSKSGRASCRICKIKIEKAKPRLGEEYEFSMGSSVRTGVRWFHLDCAISKSPDMVIQAEITMELPEDVAITIEELKKRGMQTAFAVKGFSDIKEDGSKVNVKGTILRPMSKKLDIDENGVEHQSRTLYIVENEEKGKFVLWDEHCDEEIAKDDEIVVINGYTIMGSDDKISIHVQSDSTLFINPTDEDLETGIPKIELFSSNSWKKPKGENCRFEFAKSGRAACAHCEEKINKAELKIVKPEWGESEDNGRFFPSSVSFHVRCVIEAEFGDEIIHEAVTRLTPELIEENKEVLAELKDQLEPHKELQKILLELL